MKNTKKDATSPEKGRFIFIGLEGLNWELIRKNLDEGNLPQIQKLIDKGICGKLAGVSPVSSTPLWTSIATGVRPENHGVFVDGYGTSLSCGNSNRNPTWNADSLWDIFESKGMKGHLVGWPASKNLSLKNGGALVSDSFMPRCNKASVSKREGEHSLQPESLYKEYQEFQWFPEEFTSNDLAPFIPDVAEIDLNKDDRPWKLAQYLSQMVSMNAAATYTLQGHWDFAFVFLPGLSEILNEFLRYETPHLNGISLEDHRRYAGVVRESVKLFDQLIGVLIAKAGDQASAALVSAFGFSIGEDRMPHQEGKHLLHLEHRKYPGFLLLQGEAFKKDEWIFGAHVLDIVPTLLGALQVTLPGYLQGKVLAQIFRQLPNSFASDSQSCPLLKASTELPQRPPGTSDEAFSSRELEQLDNVCRQAYFLINGGHLQLALTLLEKINYLQPYRLRPILEKIQCLYHLGQFEEALKLLEFQENKPLGGLRKRQTVEPGFLPQFDLMKALLNANLQRPEMAIRCLDRAQAAHGELFEYAAQIGDIFLSLKQWENAKSAYLKSLKYGTGNVGAYAGLAKATYRLRDFNESMEACLNALTLDPSILDCHYVLGLSLAHIGKGDEAVIALKNALQLNPNHPQIHRVLSFLYSTIKHQRALAQIHRSIAGELNRRNKKHQK